MEDCRSEFRCRHGSCNRKHHTILHDENKEENLNLNNCELDHDIKTFMQIVPIIIHYGNKHLQTSVFLDSGSDSTLISEELAEKLDLKGQKRDVSISNVLSMKNQVTSKLVDFSISSQLHDEKVEISNAWVVQNLNMKPYKIDKKDLKLRYPYLSDIKFQDNNIPDVGVLIGADYPKLHLYSDSRSPNPNIEAMVEKFWQLNPLGLSMKKFVQR